MQLLKFHAEAALRCGLLGLALCLVGLPATAGDLSALSRQFEAAWQTVMPKPPPIGISVAALAGEDRSRLQLHDGRGVRIVQVAPGSLAERMGLKAGDVVLAFNGMAVQSPEQLVQLVGARDPQAPPRFELHTPLAGPVPAAPASAQTPQPPVDDCGPNPTVECSVRLLRESWRYLRDVLR